MTTSPSFPVDLTLPAGGLRLSPPNTDDLDLLVAACQDPDIVRFTKVPSPYTVEHAQGFVESCEQGARDGTSLGLIARDQTGRLFGSCSLVSVDWTDKVAEIGYWVAPWARNRKVATRATRAVSRWAFASAGLERLTLQTAVVNTASNLVARRAGFVHEGTLRKAMIDRDVNQTGTSTLRLDVNVWGLLAEEIVDEVGGKRGVV